MCSAIGAPLLVRCLAMFELDLDRRLRRAVGLGERGHDFVADGLDDAAAAVLAYPLDDAKAAIDGRLRLRIAQRLV